MTDAYNESVFINCPFDDGYKGLFYAIVFTVLHCGFTPRCSLEEDNALVNRLGKIEKMIAECKYGIHDLSRIELNSNSLPRFNMPFELGIFFGARAFGSDDQRNKVALVLEKEKYSYQQYISDLNGVDTKAHNNDVNKVIKLVRDWLKSASKRTTIDGDLTIISDYNIFTGELLPTFATEMGLEKNSLTFSDFCIVVAAALRRNLKSH